MRKLFFIIIILAFSFGSLANGFDDHGVINDPQVNERANACYEGGEMAGKCLTDWDWEAGWYLIRYRAGLISPADFPAEYVSLLTIPDETPTVNIMCLLIIANVNIPPYSGPVYGDFSGGYVGPASPLYGAPGCITPTDIPIYSARWVTAANSASALSLCATYFGGSYGVDSPTLVAPNIYGCLSMS